MYLYFSSMATAALRARRIRVVVYGTGYFQLLENTEPLVLVGKEVRVVHAPPDFLLCSWYSSHVQFCWRTASAAALLPSLYTSTKSLPRTEYPICSFSANQAS